MVDTYVVYINAGTKPLKQAKKLIDGIKKDFLAQANPDERWIFVPVDTGHTRVERLS